MLVSAFIKDLKKYKHDQVFNPWSEYDDTCDISSDAPRIRSCQLEDYIMRRITHAKYLFIAEAAGYQGCRFTGIALTCERMLLNKHKQITGTMILGHTGHRTSHPDCPLMTSLPQQRDGMNEPTDTYVWGSIIDNKLSPEEVLLWNIFPFHPHKNSPFTNRTPTEEELMDGLRYTRQLLHICPPNITIGTIGKKAFTTLNQAGFDVSLMRHPANGGAGKFRQQFTEWIGQNRHD